MSILGKNKNRTYSWETRNRINWGQNERGSSDDQEYSTNTNKIWSNLVLGCN